MLETRNLTEMCYLVNTYRLIQKNFHAHSNAHNAKVRLALRL